MSPTSYQAAPPRALIIRNLPFSCNTSPDDPTIDGHFAKSDAKKG
jgi:hypothetical protein